MSTWRDKTAADEEDEDCHAGRAGIAAEKRMLVIVAASAGERTDEGFKALGQDPRLLSGPAGGALGCGVTAQGMRYCVPAKHTNSRFLQGGQPWITHSVFEYQHGAFQLSWTLPTALWLWFNRIRQSHQPRIQCRAMGTKAAGAPVEGSLPSSARKDKWSGAATPQMTLPHK